MAKAIQRDEAKRNRAAFLKNVVRGDTSLLVRASFLCGDYTAKAVQPTNAKHLEVGHGLTIPLFLYFLKLDCAKLAFISKTM